MTSLVRPPYYQGQKILALMVTPIMYPNNVQKWHNSIQGCGRLEQFMAVGLCDKCLDTFYTNSEKLQLCLKKL